ncbi:DsbA family protein [Yoonia sp. R2331]|uniref:DsbA family protein n=1 Tax=Yoonia sp. R2331 TaxID=3237238 RepID=UPI0034E4865A
MMLRAIALAALTLATPLAAQEAMSEAERAAFRAEVRAYLLENPEVLMEAIGVLEARQQAEQAQAEGAMLAASADQLLNDGFSFVGGNPEGDITVVEFLDYRCGYCKKAHPEVAELVSRDGNIRYIVKEFPILGEESVLASRFAVATKLVAGDDAYYDVHNTLMAYRGDFSPTAFGRMAEGLGLEAAPILAAMEGDEVAAILNANRVLGQQLQINGTPTFVVQDEMLRGYVPLDQMRQIVAELRG